MTQKVEAHELALVSPETKEGCTNTDSKAESRIQDNFRGFDWVSDPAIVIRRQPAIAIYINCRGELVIRQEADIGFDGDECVFVRPDHAEKLAKAILNAASQKPRKLRVVDGGAE
jgi:hypothetical protein